MKTKTKGKILIAAAIVLILASCIFVKVGSSKKAVITQVYTISPGDTLWDIARVYKPEDMSIRHYVNLMYRENPGLTAQVYPGQAIEVILWEE